MVPDFEARSRPKGTTRWRKRSGASEVARALALLTQRGPVRARGGVFIRSRPPSCAGDRTFRMGTKMGGIGHLAGLFGEFGVDGRNLPPAKSRGNSGTDLEGRRVTPMRPMADSRRGAVAGQLRREPWRTNAETVAIITAGIGGIYLRPNWASRGGEMARGQGFVKVQSSQITWFSLPAAQADRVAGLRETCRKPRWKGRERRQKGEKGDKKRGVGGPVSALACSSARSRNAPPSSSIGDGSAPGPCRARPYNL